MRGQASLMGMSCVTDIIMREAQQTLLVFVCCAPVWMLSNEFYFTTYLRPSIIYMPFWGLCMIRCPCKSNIWPFDVGAVSVVVEWIPLPEFSKSKLKNTAFWLASLYGRYASLAFKTGVSGG